MNEVSSATTLCSAESALVHVMVVPAATVSAGASNLNPAIVTAWPPVATALVAVALPAAVVADSAAAVVVVASVVGGATDFVSSGFHFSVSPISAIAAIA